MGWQELEHVRTQIEKGKAIHLLKQTQSDIKIL